MASLINTVVSKLTNGNSDGSHEPPKPVRSENPPRFLIIGAGSRGSGYAEAIDINGHGIVAAVAEPYQFKRETLGKQHIWGKDGNPSDGQSFSTWQEFVEYEQKRRQRVAAGEKDVPEGVDGAFVCVQDEMHREVVVGLAPLGLHIMCEKPLACSMDECLAMYKAILPQQSSKVFSIGHVLRYSPHNMTLRKLLVEDKVIGDISSVVHTEPVGWWHYTHSYVRGNWRNSETSGPSLLTKSCHDIDLLMWLLCSPEKAGQGEPHLPDSITSTGSLQLYNKSRKPAAAGSATNCMKCPLGDSGCKYSAKNVYLSDKLRGLGTKNTKWPIDIVVHDIEDFKTQDEREAALTKTLEEDYDETTPASKVRSRNWFGRCVYESDNNVCDDQMVTITWPETTTSDGVVHPPKRAAMHMVSQTVKQCDRYSYFYGDRGEIYADSFEIKIQDFETQTTRTLKPKIEHAGHGGGDLGLARQFVTAVDMVKNHGWEAKKAQDEFVGCTLEEVVRSHGVVFAAEEARLGKKVVDWQTWWNETVEKKIQQ
ncbi:oxidoreductase family, NAD-binding rossmann fold domain-containing protein [Sarocladium implicatum]|nr:oxidoreductase family, NAD-binding rossmann fold domain-containing protein [Sarocladium implicatum]